LDRCSTEQQNYDDDDEQEADRAAANPDGAAENGKQYKVHGISFVFDGKVFTITLPSP
jgi:hypothetical protein